MPSIAYVFPIGCGEINLPETWSRSCKLDCDFGLGPLFLGYPKDADLLLVPAHKILHGEYFPWLYRHPETEKSTVGIHDQSVSVFRYCFPSIVVSEDFHTNAREDPLAAPHIRPKSTSA